MPDALNHEKTCYTAYVFLLAYGVLIATSTLVPRAFGVVPSGIAILLLSCLCFKKNLHIFREFKYLGFGIIALLCVTGLSAIWSIAPDLSIARVEKLSVLGVTGFVLLAAARYFPKIDLHKLTLFMVVTFLIGTLILCIEAITRHDIYQAITQIDISKKPLKFSRLNAGATILAISIWPLLYLLYSTRQRLLAVIMFLVTLSVICLTSGDSAKFALIAAPIAFGFVYVFKKYAIGGAYLVLSTFTLTAPKFYILMNTYWPEFLSVILKRSALARIEVWDYFSQRVYDAPFIGHGIGTVRAIAIPKDTFVYDKVNFVLHTHSSVLQIWFELGLFGAITVWLLFSYAFYKVFKMNDPVKQAFYMAFFTAIFSVSIFGYGVWQGWLIGLYILATTAMIYVVNCAESTENKSAP